MDLTKYINDNLDEILDNTDDYIFTAKPQNLQKPVKHITWKEELEESSKIMDIQNEDEPTNDEIREELFQDYYDKKLQKEYLKSIGQKVPDSDEEKTEEEIEEEMSQYRLNLLNLFLIHYNEKYDKQENYFSDIKNVEKDTNNPMELFFEIIVEFKKMKEILELEEDNKEEEYLNYWFEDSDDKNIDMMYTKFPEGQMYCLDYAKKRIITPSLFICLNYLINNKKELFESKDWNIFNLRDY
jgi:hypothetical protein